jgi:light-regulated signal transduction histidine kinase (bacteriophytochrome)
MINPSRMIADSRAEPVPIVGVEPDPPDLTWSDLRSVSPIHLQYLQNMGVGASFSVPIRTADKLWGLVACHHSVARQLSPDQRKSCVSLTHSYALGLTSHLASYRLRMIDGLERRVDEILETLSRFADPLDGVEINAPALMRMLGAQGFAMALGDDVVIAGDGPDLDGLSIIDNWFVHESREGMATTDNISSLFPDQSMPVDAFSGLLAIKVRGTRTDWVRFYWFRPAEEQEVVWAGNPNKPMIENAGATRLSPRRSFERWVEIKKGYSRAWSNEDKLVASRFRNNLLNWL